MEIPVNDQIESVDKIIKEESVKKDQAELETIEIEIESPKKDDTVESVVKEDKTEKEDPFAYLDRNDFTSEKYKIEVRNLPKYYGIAVSIKGIQV